MTKRTFKGMRSIGIWPAGTALALLIAALAGGYALVDSHGRRLTEIEGRLSSFESQRQSAGAPAVQAPSTSASSQAARLKAAGTSPYALSYLRKKPRQDIRQRQQDRLIELEASFEREKIDDAWAAQTETDIRDMLAYAVAASGADATNSTVECRSSSCRIEIDMAPAEDPEDLLLQLSVDMSEILPRSRSVVLLDGKGSKRLSIFATH